MTVLAMLPPREIDGADTVSEGLVLLAESGNECRMWFAFTDVPEQNETRVGVFYEWRRQTTQQDMEEAVAYANVLMQKDKPEFVTTTTDEVCHNKANAEWLRTGKKPQTN